MTVPTLNSVAEFATNGVTTNYPFFFKFLANEDLVVTYVSPAGVSAPLTYGLQYTVNGAGDEDGGSIVTTTALAGPGQLIVSREMDAYQQTSLRNQGKFLAETHEDVFDRLTMLIQQGFSIFTRALVRPFGRDYYDAESRRIANVADPIELQDAATRGWSEQFIADILETGQGPVNNAANVIYSFPNGTVRTVQALSGADGASGIGYDGRSLDKTLNTVRATDLSGNVDKAQALMDFAASLNGQRGRLEPGTYTMTKQVNLPGNVDLDLTGAVLDFSAANAANFPDLICVRPAPGTLTLLPSLSSGTTIGQFTLPFTSAHGLVAGDAIILWDDTAFSYSGFRTNYYQGQFAVVRSVSGLNVNVTASILATMPSTIKVYKMNPVRPKIKGGDILMPTTGVFIAGLLCDIARNPEFDAVRVFGTSGGGIIQQRTLGGTVTRCETYSDREGVAADNYGLGFSNSQHCLAMGGTFHARRHGVTMGGTDLPGSVPTRFCVVDGADISSWDIQCADMHGNVEHCEYVNCIMHNGVTISGNHNAVRNSTIFAPALASTGNGVAISINEMRGTSFAFESLMVVAYGDPSTTSRAIIDCGGNSNSMTASTILGGTMMFSDITIDAPNARSPFKIVNNGSTATDKELVMNNIRWRNAPSTRTTGGILSNTSGVQFARAILDLKYRDAGAPAGLTVAADKVSGLTESGSVTFTSVAASSQDVVVTYNNRFPKNPVFDCNGNLHVVGVVVSYVPNASTTSTGTIRMYSTGGAAMTAGISVTVNWTATLNE